MRATADGDLPLPVKTALFRIVQEALTNIARHSEAKMVSVLVQKSAEEVRLLVEDDGRGFDERSARPAAGGHVGIHGMRERAAMLNGKLWIESSQGKGTTVCVVIPLAGAH